jgi:hypothetical protein
LLAVAGAVESVESVVYFPSGLRESAKHLLFLNPRQSPQRTNGLHSYVARQYTPGLHFSLRDSHYRAGLSFCDILARFHVSIPGPRVRGAIQNVAERLRIAIGRQPSPVCGGVMGNDLGPSGCEEVLSGINGRDSAELRRLTDRLGNQPSLSDAIARYRQRTVGCRSGWISSGSPAPIPASPRFDRKRPNSWSRAHSPSVR